MTIRPAEAVDIERISKIIGYYAAQGVMLPRSRGALAGALGFYMVADVDGEVVGCGGLQPYGAGTAEIYGLATAPERSTPGTGRALVHGLLARARSLNLSKVFALTLSPGFFEKQGFRTVTHQELPLKVWKDCIACPKFGNCDEIAMVLELD